MNHGAIIEHLRKHRRADPGIEGCQFCLVRDVERLTSAPSIDASDIATRMTSDSRCSNAVGRMAFALAASERARAGVFSTDETSLIHDAIREICRVYDAMLQGR